MRSFKTYMITHYLDDDTPQGDLARDIKDDANFPGHTTDFAIVYYYLKSRGACREVLQTFYDVWGHYCAFREGAEE